MSEVVLLLSGGIDSTTLLAELRKNQKSIHALSFDYGQRHWVELQYASKNAEFYKVTKHKIINLDLSQVNSSSSLLKRGEIVQQYNNGIIPQTISHEYVPGRNLMMLSMAASYAEAYNINEIYFGANMDDALRFPDCSLEFIEKLNVLWKCLPNTKNINLIAPYLNLTKAEVIRRSMELGVNLHNTISCYSPDFAGNECGGCLACCLKKKAVTDTLIQSNFQQP